MERDIVRNTEHHVARVGTNRVPLDDIRGYPSDDSMVLSFGVRESVLFGFLNTVGDLADVVASLKYLFDWVTQQAIAAPNVRIQLARQHVPGSPRPLPPNSPIVPTRYAQASVLGQPGQLQPRG